MFTAQPLAFWIREFAGDLLHERDGLLDDLKSLMSERKNDSVNTQRRKLLQRLNVINEVLGYPRSVLDPQSERDRLDVEAGRKPERFTRIEEFLKQHPEPRSGR